MTESRKYTSIYNLVTMLFSDGFEPSILDDGSVFFECSTQNLYDIVDAMPANMWNVRVIAASTVNLFYVSVTWNNGGQE